MQHNLYTRELHIALMVYLLSSKRPLDELLNPQEKDLRPVFDKLFSGMTTMRIRYSDLENTRKTIVHTISNAFTDQDKEFLLSFNAGTPKWSMFPLDALQHFPAIQWKLYNLKMMKSSKRNEMRKRLENIFVL